MCCAVRGSIDYNSQDVSLKMGGIGEGGGRNFFTLFCLPAGLDDDTMAGAQAPMLGQEVKAMCVAWQSTEVDGDQVPDIVVYHTSPGPLPLDF